MALYRVFVTRNYIEVAWFDIDAPSAINARRRAKAAAYKVKPNPRATAVDNGWIADQPTIIERVGQHSGDKTAPMREVSTGVYVSGLNRRRRARRK